MPANASSKPKTTNRRSGFQAFAATDSVARWPCSIARLIAYRPVARMGATSRKPLKAPDSSQNLSCASQTSSAPNALSARPCSRPGTGQRIKSRQPRANQASGRSKGMGRMPKLRDSTRAGLSGIAAWGLG